MGRRKWAALLAASILILLSALAIAWRRAREAYMERKGYCLDYAASFYGLIDRAIGLPFRQLTVRLAGVKEGDRVLDLGCGTGVLTLLEKEKAGRSGYAAGIDIGPKMVAKAREQAAKRGLDVDFRVASIDALPFPSDTFDVATSSFMVHHLPTEIKRAGFREVYRVLKPGGHYLIVDAPVARGIGGAISLAIARLFAPVFEELEYTLDVAEGRIPQMLKDAGFQEVQEIGGYRLAGIFPVSFVSAWKRGAKPR